jgi:hypothetical protein
MSMAERWIAEIRYTGYPDSTMMFEDLANFGALIEMDPHRDAIADIAITPNRSRRVQEIPNFLRSGQQASCAPASPARAGRLPLRESRGIPRDRARGGT